MASTSILNAPAHLTMQDFRSASHRYGGLAKSCRYAVQIKPTGSLISKYMNIASELTYLCEIAEIPGRSFLNIDLRYYGPNHKLPFQSQYEDLNLTFICRSRSLEREFFDDWMQYINPTSTFNFNYRDEYRSEIDIFQYSDTYLEGTTDENSETPVAEYRTTIYNAYPILVNPQPMTWSDDQFQRLIISFTYTHWARKELDDYPGTSKSGYSFDLVEGRNNSPRF